VEEKLFWGNFKGIKRFIPDLFTLGNLALGVVALFYLLESNYDLCISLVFLAMVLDGLDGKLAVRLKVDSERGKQLDSLCDLVSFGVVPAAVFYAVLLKDFGILGMSTAFLFPLAGAWRLARFNLLPSSEKGDFTGLPITIAGGALVAIILQGFFTGSWLALPYSFFLSFLMVSKIRYPAMKRKYKEDREGGSSSFLLFYLSIAVFIILFLFRREWIFFLLSAYIGIGFICGLYGMLRGLKKEKAYLFAPWGSRGDF